VIDYMMRASGWKSGHDLVFVPLGINYDRVLEDRSLLRASTRTRGAWDAH